MGDEELAEALASLRRLLVLVEAGGIECDEAQFQRLQGAEATLAALLEAQV